MGFALCNHKRETITDIIYHYFLLFFVLLFMQPNGSKEYNLATRKVEAIITDMSETSQIIMGICILVAILALTRKYHGWKIKRAYLYVIEDLKANNARDPESAVELPYGRKNVLRMGLKDHRPTALKSLVLDNIVGMSEDGKYYLNDKTL